MSDRIGCARCDYGFPHVASPPGHPIDATIDWSEAMNAFMYRLSVIHRRIDEEIRRELKRRVPDSIRLLRLKKLRLAVKDRLAGHVRRPRAA